WRASRRPAPSRRSSWTSATGRSPACSARSRPTCAARSETAMPEPPGGAPPQPNRLPVWQALVRHRDAMRGRPEGLSLRALFAADPGRAERFSAEVAGFLVDWSKHLVTDETLALLVRLAEAMDLPGRIEAMFRGERINTTERRPVLHVALRAPRGERILVDGRDVVPDVHAVLDRMNAFARRVRSGAWTGHT